MHSCWSPFLNTGITLANFREFRNTPVLNDKFIRVHNGSVISLFRSFSVLIGKLLDPTALFRLKVFNIPGTWPGVVGDKNVFVSVFCQERIESHLSFWDFFEYISSYWCKKAVDVISNNIII